MRHLPPRDYSPNVRALLEETKTGHCVGCGRKLMRRVKSAGRPRTVACHRPECRTAYDAACILDSRWRKKNSIPRR